MRFLFLLTILSLPLAALNLQESEQQALEANVAIQLTEQDVSQHNYRHLQSILSWMPNLTFGSMYAALQKPQNISHMQRQTQLFNNQFVLTQPIYSSELLGDLKLSKIAKQGALAGRELAINDTLFQVRVLYLDVLYTQKAVEVQQQVIGYVNTAYQDQQKKFESGSGRTLAVSEAKSALSQEITKYYTAVKAASDAKQQFVLTIHLDPTKIQGLKLDDSIGIKDYPILMQKLTALQSIIGGEIAQPASLNTPFAVFSETEIQEWINQARLNRPELKRSHLYVKASEEKSRQTKSQYLPKIEAFADYGYYTPVNGQFFRQKNDFAGGIQLSWSLFDSLKREAKVWEGTALKKAAVIAYEFENDKVEVTIRNDIQQIEEALFVYLTTADSAEIAKQALSEANISLSAGVIIDADLQNASRMAAQADLGRRQAEYNYLKSYFQLRHDAGLDAHESLSAD
ncbi:MAG TPA: TolC family protein [Rhabdochlamydiaceae bacterium]|nr:TolC family protein [Rhabdochlamydiaceae bacterium]